MGKIQRKDRLFFQREIYYNGRKDLRILTKEQKEHYQAVLQTMLEQSILSAYEKLCKNSADKELKEDLA